MLKAIFTWWNGATIGARFTIGRRGIFIGQDATGNRYFEAKDNRDSYDGRKHYTFDDHPINEPLKRQSWEKDHKPNLSGTIHAWRPKGAIGKGGQRPEATGDYQAWKPD